MNNKRHHYNPQYYLKVFTNKKGQINIFDKKEGKKFVIKPKDIFVEANFFNLENAIFFDPENKEAALNLEQYLAIHESKVAKFISKIIKDRSLEFTTEEDFCYIIEHIAWLYIATPQHKRMIKNRFNKLGESVSDETCLNIFMSLHQTISDIFLNRLWILATIDNHEKKFIIASPAVGLLFEELLNDENNIEACLSIYFPLSPNLLLYGIKKQEETSKLFLKKSIKIDNESSFIELHNYKMFVGADRFVSTDCCSGPSSCLLQQVFKV